MSRSRLCTLAAFAGGMTALPALDLQQTLTGEVLVEYVHQQNYTDGNGEDYVFVNPGVYQGIEEITEVGDQLFIGGFLIDQDTYRLTLLARDAQTYYEDRVSQMWLRARLGAKVELGDSIETEIGLVFDGEGGDRAHLGASGSVAGGIYLNDASILFKRFILPELHLRVGRQPVSWNLRRDYGAFLYDSRADNPAVTSWDGLRGFYQFDTFTFSPYVFSLDESREERSLQVAGDGTVGGTSNSKDNWLLGLQVDWQPEVLGNRRYFVTAGASVEKNAPIRDANPLTGSPAISARSVISYYVGVEAEIGWGVTLYGEGAFQDGDFDAQRDVRAVGFSLGAEWDVGGLNQAVLGVQYDYASGDKGGAQGNTLDLFADGTPYGELLGVDDRDRLLLATLFPVDPNDDEYNAFINPHEGVSDALIVEHERYGELSELLDGNLHGIKARAEYRFDQLGSSTPVDLRMLWAYYVIDKPVYQPETLSDGASYFGQEFDLTATWQYNAFTTINLFGGIFLPGLGYQQVAASRYPASRAIPEDLRGVMWYDEYANGETTAVSWAIQAAYPRLAGDDPIYLFGLNAQVVF